MRMLSTTLLESGQDVDIVREESDGVDLQVVSLNKTDPFGEIVHRRQFRNR